MGDQPARPLVPGMGAFNNPSFGLNDKALGDDIRPQRLLGELPSAGGAVTWVADDLYADAVSLLDGRRALAAVGRIGVELLEAGNLGACLRCRRRFKSEPPRRPNIEPGVEADFEMVGCG